MFGRRFKDSFSSKFMYISVLLINFLIFFILIILIIKAFPLLFKTPLSKTLFSSEWSPAKGQFGFLSFIIGTLYTTLLAMLISVPICLLSAIYLSEYAGKKLRNIISPFIDILAGIPSVVYGLFGILVIVPFVSWLGKLFSIQTTGYTLLAGGIILAIMTFPIIISLSTEVFKAVPRELREASMALGATKWQTVKKVVLKSSLHGIFAVIILGFSRAIGETMAVLMVIGNVPAIPKSIFDPTHTLTSLIANNYGEMMSVPLYDSALMSAALILFVIVAIFNIFAHIALSKIRRKK